ncbi:energy transducer TonB [Methylocaldum sp.]|jgi:protein TonB|uniref:energy transducer TonB n=1 Tax=Methylocaldum sp. TaxID=1969727 RepID=UPI00321F9C52
MSTYFFSGDPPFDGPGGTPVTMAEIPATWKRPLAVAAAAGLAAVLHGLLFFWYLARPEPVPFTEAAPLPMIDMVLSAPPAPAVTQPTVPSPPTPPKEAKKPDPKPVKKPKPKPVRKDSAVKQVEPQKQEQADTAPPAPAAPSAPPQDRAAAPRNDTYTPASSNANYLNNPKPVYPGIARRRHWEGLVLLRVYVTADGRCGELSVQRSSGHDVLDEAALEAVKKWRFVPAKRGDVAQASWVTVPIEFQLE